jgi:cytochrome c-type biogenesis protein CcmH/NrfF
VEAAVTTLPLWISCGGVVLLGLFLAYGISRNRDRTRREKIISEDATKQLYKTEDRAN